MFRISINYLRSISSNYINKKSQKYTQLALKTSYNPFLNRLLHTSIKSLKKKSQFLDLTKKNETTNTNKSRVKLYPGFQESVEEIKNQENDEIKAKKVIEDFYGLNELEYEENMNELESDTSLIEDKNVNFDIDYVVETLRKENVHDLCCIEIPKEINYADYMLIGTCLSDKHLNSVFQILNRKYKALKNEKSNYLPRKTGKETKWCALDTGKMVIHLFLEDYRLYYDLETLWSCGNEFDEKYIEFAQRQSDIEKRLLVTDEENFEKF